MNDVPAGIITIGARLCSDGGIWEVAAASHDRAPTAGGPGAACSYRAVRPWLAAAGSKARGSGLWLRVPEYRPGCHPAARPRRFRAGPVDSLVTSLAENSC
jgi:hypothetical protein